MVVVGEGVGRPWWCDRGERKFGLRSGGGLMVMKVWRDVELPTGDATDSER